MRRLSRNDRFAGRLGGRIAVGLGLIVVGLTALLDNLHLLDARQLQPYWPLLLVMLGLARLLFDRRRAGPTFSLGLVLVGAALTANNLGLLRFDPHAWWPALLILAGASVVARGLRPPRLRDLPAGDLPRPFAAPTRADRLDASALMSGLVLKCDSPSFQGGEINAVMGSIEVDLQQASIVGEARLEISVVMGNVELRVPRDWSVVVSASPVLGGIEDKTVPPPTGAKRLLIDGAVVMGGITIFH